VGIVRRPNREEIETSGRVSASVGRSASVRGKAIASSSQSLVRVMVCGPRRFGRGIRKPSRHAAAAAVAAGRQRVPPSIVFENEVRFFRCCGSCLRTSELKHGFRSGEHFFIVCRDPAGVRPT